MSIGNCRISQSHQAIQVKRAVISGRVWCVFSVNNPTPVVRITDEALVVRGGRNHPEDIQRGTGTHPSGVTGISVECAVGLSVAELAVVIPHRLIGVTTVTEVRKAGGDVIRTSGRSVNHATLTGLAPEQISRLLTPTIPNPTRQQL